MSHSIVFLISSKSGFLPVAAATSVGPLGLHIVRSAACYKKRAHTEDRQFPEKLDLFLFIHMLAVPEIPAGKPNAPAMMLGDHCADLVRAQNLPLS
ncbi:hypothetical protein IMCC3135_15315 [Granulosicoccus antarcticus IMCC3135]|uniref:Uncharacterized protein n=1 Tax=Granulosicoccus antarcticus IMCC3135 TaxID=1192854 RepID=A0A2Z2NZB8_9GAMM|nr:hypothetical protein IMCC3135_15315 [Granulosicoccus antarcticus IMCC3135]